MHEDEPAELNTEVVDKKLEEVSVTAKDATPESAVDTPPAAEVLASAKAETPAVALPPTRRRRPRRLPRRRLRQSRPLRIPPQPPLRPLVLPPPGTRGVGEA